MATEIKGMYFRKPIEAREYNNLLQLVQHNNTALLITRYYSFRVCGLHYGVNIILNLFNH